MMTRTIPKGKKPSGKDPVKKPAKTPPRRPWTRYLLYGLSSLLLLLLIAVGAIIFFLRGSLPQTEGTLTFADLEAPVEIERDLQGVVTIRGGNRLDVAFATGFVHGQERFFQMDLARRQAAGELAELLGKAALRRDRENRPHALRTVAEVALNTAEEAERALVERYAAGVRSGVEALRTVPFEYGLLGVDPEPWQAEDCYLVLLTMFLELEDEAGRWEMAHGLLEDSLSPEMYRFVTLPAASWDAPLMPGPPSPPMELPKPFPTDSVREEGIHESTLPPEEPEPIVGSNLWAVAGHRTPHGKAIVANDMHLSLSLPNIWFRAHFSWPQEESPENFHQVTGATLPGLPVMVIGSNGNVAWGLANSRIDTTDVVLFEEDQEGIEERTEILKTRGQADEELKVRSTPWGPILGQDAEGRHRAVRWVAHNPEAVDLRFRAMETAGDVGEALDIGQESGMPALSLVVGDREGRIGWTYTGRLPRRQGSSGQLPSLWQGEATWAGWLAPEEVPRLVDPESGVLWAANNRLVEGPWLARVGDGGYSFGARARQIRDQLLAIEEADIDDMLAIQLDDRALYLEPWRELLLDVLPESEASNELRKQLAEWDGRALQPSVAYRATYSFRREMLALTLEPFLEKAQSLDEDLPFRGFERQWQDSALLILQEKKDHLLNPRFNTWDALLQAGVEAAEAAAQAEALQTERGWRPVQIRHPLSRALPGIGNRLNIKPVRLPGGPEVPRLQMPRFGASQRMAVSPGSEDEGYFHMPGGQSGHPLSPFYRSQQQAWAEGQPTPFLPGPASSVLRLEP